MLNLDKVKSKLQPEVFDSINALRDRGDLATLKKWLVAAKEHYKFIGPKAHNSDALNLEIEYIKYLLEIKENKMSKFMTNPPSTKLLTHKEKVLVKEYVKKIAMKKQSSSTTKNIK